jgi:ABC-2 type transport system permease protein
MSTPTDAAPATRPLYWSVRRELWENRSIVLAPLGVAGVVLFGFLISTIGMPERRRAALLLDEAHRQAAIQRPYDMAAMMLLLAAMIVGLFYCVDALYGERRDRSILFWKSVPVSDLTTVLAKASIPLVILPLITFAVVVATQLLMMLLSTAILLPSGLGGTTWAHLPFLRMSIVLLYGLIALVLWHAPMYGWLLLVSGWARRAPLLWAVLPLFAVAALEKVAFNTSYFASLLKYRFMGHLPQAFIFKPGGRIDSLSQLTPGRFLSTPGLWIGLVFAAAFFATAVRLRRSRGPI